MPTLPTRRRKLSTRRARWEELWTFVAVVGGLLILVLSVRSFHSGAAERSDALQQVRAAKGARSVAAAAQTESSTGLGRRGVAVTTVATTDEQRVQVVTDTESKRGTEPKTASSTSAAAEYVAIKALAGWDNQGEPQQFCEEHFGMEWLRRWGATAQQVCIATQHLQTLAEEGDAGGGGGGRVSGVGSTLICRSMNDTHMPAASAPHVLCDATNLWLDPSKLRRARCPRHRPRYLCTSPTYHQYQLGAWGLNCSWPTFRLADFSRDHQQDMFEAMLTQPEGYGSGGSMAQTSGGSAQQPSEVIEGLPTLLVTREIKEHANVFHTFTDLLNVYVSLVMLGWEQAPRQVVILDNHPPGPLDIFWPVVAAGGGTAVLPSVRQLLHSPSSHPWHARLQDVSAASHLNMEGSSLAGRLLVRRVSDFKGPVLFRHAVFVPPGYTSLLFAHLYEDSSCPLRTTLFARFRHFFLSSFGLEDSDLQGALGRNAMAAAAAGRREAGGTAAGNTASAAGTAAGFAAVTTAGANARRGGIDSVLKVRFISRRPGKGRARMARQVANEDELLGALRSVASAYGSHGSNGAEVAVEQVDFAQLTVEQQLTLVHNSDILVGMHGAALAYALLLPPHAALVELWPQASGIWRCYQNFAQWAGVLYQRVANADPSRYLETPSGDLTEVNASQVARVVQELLPVVQQRRKERCRLRQE